MITITKDTFRRSIQGVVNSYEGTHGKVDESIFFEIGKRFNKNNVEGLYGIKDNTLYIIYQGSRTLSDWVSNLKFKLVHFKSYLKAKKIVPFINMNTDIEVHHGFITQYHTIREIVHNILVEHLKNEIRDVIIIGHSLGGSIAQLTALDFQYCYRDNNHFGIMLNDIACITFGSPRVGNKYFIVSYNKRVPKSFRFTFEQDIVPSVPFLACGYKHGNTHIKLKKKKSVLEKILRSYRYITRSTDNHYPEEYQIGIEECISESFLL